MGTKVLRTLRNLAVLSILAGGVGLFAIQAHAIPRGCRVCPCGGYVVCGAAPCPDCPVI